MKNYITILLLLLIGGNALSAQKTEQKQNQDAVFDEYKVKFIEQLWQIYPAWASSVGYHAYDSLLIAPDDASRNRELKFISMQDSLLHQFNIDTLSPNNRMDYKLLENYFQSVRFNISVFKSYEWDPSTYNIGSGIFDILDYHQYSLEDKLRILTLKLSKVPAYYAAAKKSIVKPTREHTLLAVSQNKGTMAFFLKDLPDSLKLAKLNPAEVALFEKNKSLAKAAVENYLNWLTADVLPKLTDKNSHSFRIGKELYEKKFALELNSAYTAKQMYNKALARKQFVHAEMTKVADGLWPKYFGSRSRPKDSLTLIHLLIDTISVQHCNREDFLRTIQRQLPELVQFVNEHHLLGLDPTKPLEVRSTPGYMAGVAGASLNSPGPYDKGGVTYYNVTPLTDYTDSEAESYLREYNNYVLQILNIHEAIPGHYVQGVYANRSPSIIKTILGNGATVEGWACYVERMMLEEGYKDSPEMLLFYYKWNLREVCNFILDYNIHCNNWSREQVQNLLVNEAFQQTTEAIEKYRRATLSQVQLASYFTGLTELYEFREEAKVKLGDKFKLNKFHERFLSFGSAPIKEIRQLLMKQERVKE
ncbi:MAG: DUF885 domain-containing protein [Chitinophagales bacterium]